MGIWRRIEEGKSKFQSFNSSEQINAGLLNLGKEEQCNEDQIGRAHV